MNDERTKRIEERVKRTKAAAHERVVKDGTIQFRLDAENIQRLLQLADDRRTGAGVLARMWVLERLNKENAANPDVVPQASTAPLTVEEIQLMRTVSRNIVSQEAFLAQSWAEQLVQIQTQINCLSQLMHDMMSKQSKAS